MTKSEVESLKSEAESQKNGEQSDRRQTGRSMDRLEPGKLGAQTLSGLEPRRFLAWSPKRAARRSLNTTQALRSVARLGSFVRLAIPTPITFIALRAPKKSYE